jgi:hypothetical protein
MAAKTIQLVFSNPTEGKEAEFNEWYDTVHVHEIVAIPGIVSAQRYDLYDAEITRNEAFPPAAHRYLTIYEMDGDVDEIMGKITDSYASGTMTMSDSLDVTTSVLSFWSPRGPKVAG